MKKIAIYLFILILITPAIVFSQGVHNLNTIIPPSPNAASLGLFGAVPVGHYTGTAEIKIPIYEMELDGKIFPISLSYHTSGIKVAQEASCVGLGWSLSGIGCIVKQIRGNDDFLGGLGYFEENDPLTPEEVAIMNNPTSDDEIKLKLLSKLDGHVNALKDGEPDFFYFNFGNYAGTMFFGRKAQSGISKGKAKPIIEKEKNNLDIEFNYIGDGSWKIVDGDGYIYHFRTREITNNKTWVSTNHISPEFVKRDNNLFSSAPTAPYGNTTAWYLDEIISPNNNSIKFRYQSESIYTLMTLNERTTHFKYFYGGRLPSPNTITSNSYSYAEIEQQVISQIETPSGIINFELCDRYDIEPINNMRPKRIEGINIENKDGDHIKSIELKYDEQGTKGLYHTYRFFLKEVNDYTYGNIRYKMTYDTQLLPSKYSNQTDKWGYYNGKSASGLVWNTKDMQLGSSRNITYIPEYQYKKSEREIITYLGRRIEVNPTKIKAGSLNSIEYPTGLKTNFTYSPNQVTNSGIPATEDWVYKSGGGVIYKNYTFDDIDEENEYTEMLIAKIKIPKGAKNIQLHHRFYYYDDKRPGGWNDDITSLTYNYILISDENKILHRYPRNPLTIWLPNSDLIGDDLAGKEITLKLSPNILEELTTKYRYFVTASITYEELVNRQPSNYGAGLRIDEITTIESSGEVVKKQFYEYNNGLVMNNSYFHFDYDILEQYSPAPNDYTYAGYVVGVSSPHNGFSSSAEGSHVGYSRVSERQVYKDTDEKINYYFRNNVDREQYRGYYFSPPNFPRYKNLDNGTLYLKKVFSKANDPIQTTEYIYSPYNYQSVVGVKVYGIPSFIDTENKHFALDSYNLRSQTWRLTEEITTNFYNNGEISSSTKYNYSDTNDLPTQIITTGEDGIIHKMIYKYSTDFQNTMTDKLKDRNMINIRLETIKTRMNQVIDGKKTEFTDTLGLLLPKTYHQLNLPQGVMLSNYASHFHKIYSFDKYNKLGKVIQATSQNRIPVVYLWSYLGQYPIAEIKNATYKQVSDILGQSFIDKISQAVVPSETDMKTINNLRSNQLLANSHITTYTYKPLVGMTSFTDPSGFTTYYEYDGFGRLQRTYYKEKDNSGKELERTIQTYKYNYQNK